MDCLKANERNQDFYVLEKLWMDWKTEIHKMWQEQYGGNMVQTLPTLDTIHEYISIIHYLDNNQYLFIPTVDLPDKTYNKMWYQYKYMNGISRHLIEYPPFRSYQWKHECSFEKHIVSKEIGTVFNDYPFWDNATSIYLKVFVDIADDNQKKSQLKEVMESLYPQDYDSMFEREGIWFDVEPKYVPQTLENWEEVDNIDLHTWQHYRFTQGAEFWGHSFTLDDLPDNPFPITDIIYCWDVPYYYYGLTRPKIKGKTPVYFYVTTMKSPITINVSRIVIDGKNMNLRFTDRAMKSKILWEQEDELIWKN